MGEFQPSAQIEGHDTTFDILEDWEGEIISIDDLTFDARMVPTDIEDNREVVISFQLSDVPGDMLERTKGGATLRWIHGKTDDTRLDVFDIDLAPGLVPFQDKASSSLAERVVESNNTPR